MERGNGCARLPIPPRPPRPYCQFCGRAAHVNVEFRMVLVALSLVLVAITALVAASLYGAHQMTRLPRVATQGQLDGWQIPRPEQAHFHSRDGLELAGWWFPSHHARGSIVACHGHGGGKVSMLWVVAPLLPQYNVLLLDTRGHGESGGDRTSVGYLERLDVIAAVDWVHQREPEAPIGLLGISMGAAASIMAAAESPNVRAVVADSSFAQLRTPVSLAICERGYPSRIAPLLAWSVCRIASLQLGFAHHRRTNPVHRIADITPRPLLIIHGTEDSLIPPSEANALYAAARAPKDLWMVPGASHAMAVDVAPEEYGRRVVDFFGRWLQRRDWPSGRLLDGARTAKV